MKTAELKALLARATPGPWHKDGQMWDQIVWSDNETRVCFMAHSNGLNDARDEANARVIAAAPDLAADNIRLREGLAEIASMHIPDQPAASGGSEEDWVRRQYANLRAMARALLGETL